MSRFLLDTNVLSDLVRNPQGRTARHLAEQGDDNVVTSILVAAELRYGVAKLRLALLAEQVEAVLGAIEVLPFEPPADSFYGELRATLEKAGRTIGGMDLLIAAHALAIGHVLVTDNVREFSRVPGLSVENWLR
jgi:tRNA(fMet)-specific endonuclease VapC